MECEMETFSLVLILICSISTIKGLTLRKRGKIRSIEREWKRRSELPNDWWILRNFPLPRFSRDRWKELDRFYQRGSITDNINERKKEGPAKNLIWTRNLFPKYSFRKICNSHTFKWDLFKDNWILFSIFKDDRAIVVGLKFRPDRENCRRHSRWDAR